MLTSKIFDASALALTPSATYAASFFTAGSARATSFTPIFQASWHRTT